MPMTNLNVICRLLVTAWATSDLVPNEPLQASTPELAELMDAYFGKFNFDSLRHAEVQSGWIWKSIPFTAFLEGSFSLYLPHAWNQVRLEGESALVMEKGSVWQSLFLLNKVVWQESIGVFFDFFRVIGYAYRPVCLPHCHQWILVTKANGSASYWTWAIHTFGEWLVMIKGEAPTPVDVSTQIISLISSDPWGSWLKAINPRNKPNNYSEDGGRTTLKTEMSHLSGSLN